MIKILLVCIVGVGITDSSIGTKSEEFTVFGTSLKQTQPKAIISSTKAQREQKPYLTSRSHRRPLLMKHEIPTDYTTYCEGWEDIVMFSYFDSTNFKVDSTPGWDTLWYNVWSGTLNLDQYYHLALPGSYAECRIVGSEKFSLLMGEPITNGVVGYYAVDENGKGLSTKFLTYMPPKWDGNEKFIIFSYEDGTSGQVYVPSTGYTGNFNLNAGEHYVETDSVFGKFIKVTANKPVSAFSYADQGTFVPSENGSFLGHTFYTYLGTVGGWAHDLNMISYENNVIVTVIDIESDTVLYGPDTINAGEVATFSTDGSTDFWIKVESTGNITVSIQPFYSYNSDYFYLVRNIDSSGDGVGTLFYALSLENGSSVNAYVTGFPYQDTTTVTVWMWEDTGWVVVGSIALDAGNDFWLCNPKNTICKFISDKPISCFSWCAGGADFTLVWQPDTLGVSYRDEFKKPFLKIKPNPFIGFTVIKFSVPGDCEDIKCVINDLSGRVVKIFNNIDDGKIIWNGADDDGKIAAAGIYFFTIKTRDSTLATKILKLQ